MELKDLEDLVDFGVAIEHRVLFHQFSRYATHGPYVHAKAVLFLT
jgi:hypothetical protein